MASSPRPVLPLSGPTKAPLLDRAKVEAEAGRFESWYEGLSADEKATIDGLAEIDVAEARAKK